MECWKQFFFPNNFWKPINPLLLCISSKVSWFKDFIYFNNFNCADFNFPMNFCMPLNMLSHTLFIMALGIYISHAIEYIFSYGKTHIKKNYVLIQIFIMLLLQIWILMLYIYHNIVMSTHFHQIINWLWKFHFENKIILNISKNSPFSFTKKLLLLIFGEYFLHFYE